MLRSFFKLVSVIILSGLALQVLYSNPSLGVYGGLQTSEKVHSSIVNIVFERTVCSGVIISLHVALTAAHCLNRGGKPLQVAHIDEGSTAPCDIANVTSYDLEPSSVITPFKVYSPDILIIKIETPLCSSHPMSLSNPNASFSDSIKLAGHGGNEYSHGVSSEIEAKIIESSQVRDHVYVSPGTVAERVVKNFFAERNFKYLFAIPEKPKATICVGDSGGPVFVETEDEVYLKGVNGVVLSNEKLGLKKCDFAYVQAFTPIAPYLSWIKQKILEWEN